MAVTSLDPDRVSGRHSPLLALLQDDRRVWAVLGGLLILSLALQFAVPMNHDAAWYLHSAKAFLEGGRLYNDIYLEMNLPLPLFMAVPPVALSEATGIFVVHAFRIYVFAWMLFSFWLTWRSMEGLLPEAGHRRGVMICIVAAVALVPMDHFGQREHFLIIACLPYLMLAARRAEGLPLHAGLAALIGAQAAFGLALKPHFLLLPAALEVWLLWRRREPLKLFRPETLSLGVLVSSYAALVYFYTPEFFSLIVPMAIDLYDGYKGKPWWAVLALVPVPFAILTLFIFLRNRRALARTALPDVLAVAMACSFIIYFVQMKGWRYHLYPTVACLIVLLGLIVLLYRPAPATGEKPGGHAPAAKRSVMRSALASCLVVFGSACWDGYIVFEDQYLYLRHMVPALRQHADGASFSFMTTTLSASFPLTHYAGVRYVSRFPMHWPIGDLLRYRQRSPDRVGQAERQRLEAHEKYYIDAMVTDFIKRPPKVVIVDQQPEVGHFTDVDLDFIGFFSADPRFAKLWSEYRVVDRLGYFTIFAR